MINRLFALMNFSSLSTGLNSMAAVVMEDWVKPLRKTPFSNKTADILMKLTVVILGAICVALVFIVEKAGSHVLQVRPDSTCGN